MAENNSRMYLRLPEKTKQKCILRAKQNKETSSEYIRNLIDNDGNVTPCSSLPTHEELTSSYQFVNRVENLLYSYPTLPTDFKKKLKQEIINYGRY